jgi:CRP/FNR family transcriptional regulator
MVSDSKTSCTVVDYKCKCFEVLTPEELELISQNEVHVSYKKGETICKQGTFASHIVIMEEGLAKVSVEECDRLLILKIIPEGNLIGLTAISDHNNTFQYSATAYVDSKARLIDTAVFKKIVKENAAFSFELLNLLAANNVQIYGRFFCLTNKQSYGKLADILLCLADRVYKKREFDLLLSRKELAELSDMSTENVIRMLKKFKEDGLIDIKGKKFAITNYENLKQISDLG